jgi:hypothetical protein
MAKIVASCWRTNLPTGYAPIGISRGTPRNRGGYRRYTKLQPGSWFSTTGLEEFTRLYNEEILGPLDPEAVVEDLLRLGGGQTPALLCWEPPEPSPKWCHRSLVSVWLWEELRLEVPELGQEHEGFGWSHPKLHPDVRREHVECHMRTPVAVPRQALHLSQRQIEALSAEVSRSIASSVKRETPSRTKSPNWSNSSRCWNSPR